MIANALDADNKYTAAQISHKLKQLGLNIPKRKSLLEASNQSAKDNNNNDTFASESKEQLSNGESLALKKRYTICSHILVYFVEFAMQYASTA